jgi:hypothetical protein
MSPVEDRYTELFSAIVLNETGIVDYLPASDFLEKTRRDSVYTEALTVLYEPRKGIPRIAPR